MKFWFDTEFIEDGRTIDLISIGVVAQDGREFYAQNQECDWSRASDWVARNVLIHLAEFDMGERIPANYSKHRDAYNPKETGGWWRQSGVWRRRNEIAASLIELTGFPETEGYTRPEFWAYYADYDWVVLCQLFGTMMELPKGWPMVCYDVKQWCDMLGNPQLPVQSDTEHHALADARHCRKQWEYLDLLSRGMAVTASTSL